ncbi:long-chain fatty acid--CoA ligase [Cycloclasticus sp. 46_120_T64]|nr:long-chain fatty acid--CoA ligase [Cycloclasticus sp. 46_120_T64]
MNKQLSLGNAFDLAATEYANNIAVVDTGKRYTFSELKIASDKLALGLVKKSVSKGDRVALYCINSVEFAICYMAIIKVGAVVVPVNLLQKAAEICYVLTNATVKGLIYHQSLQSTVDELKPMLNHSMFDLCINEPTTEATAWNSIFDNDGVLPAVDIDAENDLAAILYTSGTTGKPKGAMLTHRNLIANTSSVYQAMKWRKGEDVVMLVLPMFHAFAATVGMLTPLTHGCCFVPMARFEVDKLSKVIEQTKATVFLGVPSMFNVLLNTHDDKTSRFESLRMCISGGASMPVDVLNRFESKFNLAIYEGDGPTECSPVTCVNPIGGVRKIGTVGLPVPNVEMKIIDEQGKELPYGEIGEIAVRGPSVMKGYWRMGKATDESFRGDWFLTGDLGNEDEDGYFSILDRKKDMVIVNGMNVYPRIIEEVLYRLDAIAEAAVIGRVDKTHGEIPVAYVVIREGYESDAADIRSWCRQHLANYEVPRKVIFLESLPKNAAGKIVKRVLDKQGELERGVQA